MSSFAKVFLISFIFVSLLFSWQGNKGFNFSDEGFLWYGAQRVLAGEVPIRDFMAYDPGRYYWSAAIMGILGGSGIMDLRIAIVIFQFLGLLTGMLLIAQSVNIKTKYQTVFYIISALTLVVWMVPRHKLFDISVSIFLIGILTYLVQNPSPKRYFLAGLCVGLAAVFGRNHGVYGLFGSAGVIIWLNIKRTTGPKFLNSVFCWCSGVVVGFLPIVFMVLLIPGFKLAFWQSIMELFELKRTNIPLPVPWPWTVDFAAATPSEAVRGVLIGMFFIGSIAFGVLSILWVIRQRLKEKQVPPGLVPAAFLSLPYVHFIFSRADVWHLAQGIFPLLVGALVIFANLESRIRWSLASALCALSIWGMHVFHPGWQYLTSQRWVNVEISGNNLLVEPYVKRYIALFNRLTKLYASDGRAFLALPCLAGAYAMMDTKSPIWDIYALFPRTAPFEKEEIERIKATKPGFVYLRSVPLDGKDELKFSNTHPLVYRFIVDNFELVPNLSSPDHEIYIARSLD